MSHPPTAFGFSDSMNSATLGMKAAVLEFAQQVHQYQMGCIHAELADYEAAIKSPKKSLREPLQSQKMQMDLVHSQYFRVVNYWTGLSQVMLQGTTQMALAMRKCGVDSTQQLREQTGTPAMPDYIQSVVNSGMDHFAAGFDASRRFAEENAHAVLDAGEDHSTEAVSKHAKNGSHAKHTSRHTAEGSVS